MPTAQDLMGLSMPWDLAGELGNDVSSINGAGTTAGAATPITTHFVLVSGASSQTGAILPANAKIGTPYFVVSKGSAAAVIYPPANNTINSGAASVTMSAAVSAGIFIRASTTVWYTIPLAP
jgi:hypothetical protein